MRAYTYKIIAWLLLTALLSALVILKFKLYVCCQSVHGRAMMFLLPPAFALMMVRKWENIKWNIKSFFYKQQKIQ